MSKATKEWPRRPQPKRKQRVYLKKVLAKAKATKTKATLCIDLGQICLTDSSMLGFWDDDIEKFVVKGRYSLFEHEFCVKWDQKIYIFCRQSSFT